MNENGWMREAWGETIKLILYICMARIKFRYKICGDKIGSQLGSHLSICLYITNNYILITI